MQRLSHSIGRIKGIHMEIKINTLTPTLFLDLCKLVDWAVSLELIIFKKPGSEFLGFYCLITFFDK